MLSRLLTWAVRSYVGGPGRSWIFTSAALALVRLVRSSTGRREVVDLSSIKPGERYVIEHLDVSHKTQIRQEKRSKRQARKDKRRARRTGS